MSWAHAPAHKFEVGGTYMLTAGTYRKAQILTTSAHLDYFTSLLQKRAAQFNFELQAWAVFSNHYHCVLQHCGAQLYDLQDMIKRLHGQSAIEFNRMDNKPGRKVWFQFWDTLLTDERLGSHV